MLLSDESNMTVLDWCAGGKLDRVRRDTCLLLNNSYGSCLDGSVSTLGVRVFNAIRTERLI
jgi:hypothetical protein